MARPLAIADCELDVTVPIDNGRITGFHIDKKSAPSVNIFVNNLAVFVNLIKFEIASGMVVENTNETGTTGVGTAQASYQDEIKGTGSNAVEVNVGNTVLQGDSVDVDVVFTFPLSPTPSSPPYTKDVTYTVTVSVKSAGQNDVTLD